MKKPSQKIASELFDVKNVDHAWIESFYEYGWNNSDMKFTEFEKQILHELGSFLPRHMDVYDWNQPYAEAMILIIRNLLNGKKLITGEQAEKEKS